MIGGRKIFLVAMTLGITGVLLAAKAFLIAPTKPVTLIGRIDSQKHVQNLQALINDERVPCTVSESEVVCSRTDR